MPDPTTYTINGKQVLRNGRHFADADSPEVATLIVKAMGARLSIATHMDGLRRKYLDKAREQTLPERERDRFVHYTQAFRIAAADVAARFDEPDEPAPPGVRATYNDASEQSAENAKSSPAPESEVRARCGDAACAHEWTVAILPMDLEKAAHLMKGSRCPRCANDQPNLAGGADVS